MVTKYSDDEIRALDSKENDAENVVLCPRCGKELIYREVGNSYEIKCPSVNCIRRAIRGI